MLSGEAGQGINTVSEVLTNIAHSAGIYAFTWTELMSRIRGGVNSTQIRLSNKRIRAPVHKIDVLIPLNENAFYRVKNQISEDTLILSEINLSGFTTFNIPYLKKAKEIGNPLFANIIAVGVLIGLTGMSFEGFIRLIRKHFRTKGDEIIEKNAQAGKFGYQIGDEIRRTHYSLYNPVPDAGLEAEKIIDGSKAIALGAIAGGVNFIAAYPMTPSSGVWTYLAQIGKDLDIITEQAEDEISAMNMGLGASYAGARAMVTTSGGGFDLMTEGLSLAGIQETPIVIHLAQRPGPATGLPTRTEQADLELALYAGHGEFPRIILTPGNYEQGFYLTQKAFNLADKYQVPVFILTDQFFIDSSYSVAPFNLENIKIENYIVETKEDYKRYEITESGISPRGIPNYGKGFVNADCHHHSEDGHISEDLQLRTKMMNKLMNKYKAINADLIEPEFIGSKNYNLLVLCWGSNYEIVKETIEQINSDDVAMLHFSQVHPIHPITQQYLKSAKRICIIENNATGQMAKLLKLNFGVDIKDLILKYNGLPFYVEEVRKAIEELM